MIENPSTRIGMIAQKRAEIHFISQGYSVCWPMVDNGFDLLIHKNDGKFVRVQVKNMPPKKGVVNLNGAGINPGTRNATALQRESRRAASLVPRHYDILVIVSDEYVWVIPESSTRGITGLGLKNSLTGEWLVKSKWDQFREERLDG